MIWSKSSENSLNLSFKYTYSLPLIYDLLQTKNSNFYKFQVKVQKNLFYSKFHCDKIWMSGTFDLFTVLLAKKDHSSHK